MQKNLQFVTDAEGHRTAVILPIEECEEMMEDLKMGRAARERKSQPRRPFEDVVKEMRAAKLMLKVSITARAEREQSSHE
jgi:hypothetical protein